MTTVATELVTRILGHSEAEKAFQPWWDNMEDFLMYSLVMLGIVVAPTAFIFGTPLDCTQCQEDFCGGKRGRDGDPNFNAWWIKKYCTMTAVDQFILYFPYILLLLALVIVMVERVFGRIFKSGMKLSMFYNLLVKEAIQSADGKVGSGDSGESAANKALQIGSISDLSDLENSRTAIEVSKTFQENSYYMFSYVMRMILQLLISFCLFAWLTLSGLQTIDNDQFIYCDVHGYLYECAGHPQQFYRYILLIAVGILVLYVLCHLYNIFWLTIPQMGALSRVMRKYKRLLRRATKDKDMSDKQMLGELYNIYYNNRNLKLLLDLLAESSGMALSIRIIALFDADFRAKCEPFALECQRRRDDVAFVKFQDSPTMKEIFSRISDLVCVYTIEIVPSTKQSRVIALTAGEDRMGYHRRGFGDDTEMRELSLAPSGVKFCKFFDLKPDVEYTIRVSTLFNGKAIAKRSETIPAIED